VSIIKTVLGNHGTGWIPNPKDKRDFGIDRLGLSSQGLPSSHSMWGLVSSVRNQGGSSSCVGQAIANAVSIREVIVYPKRYPNRKAEPASALFPYWNSRYLHGSQKVDSGTYIRLAMKAMVRIGIPDEAYWKFSTLRVNKQPSIDAYMRAHGRRDGTYITIQDIGTARADAVKAAIAANYPVVFGARIDKAFLNDAGPSIIDVPTNTIAGHAMVLIGYYYNEEYGIVYEILNSWGSRWRVGGRAWITEKYLRHLLSIGDLTICYGWRNIA
jgi:hypothetical protein